MAAVTVHSDFGAQENSLSLFPVFPHLFAMKWWDWMPCSWMLSFKPDSSLPSFIFIKRLFSSSLLSASIFGLCLKLTVSRSTSLDVLDRDFPGDAMVKNLPGKSGDTGDVGLTPVLGRSPREGNGNPLQYSCLENSMDRGARWATVHGVRNSWTWLSTQQNTYVLEISWPHLLTWTSLKWWRSILLVGHVLTPITL